MQHTVKLTPANVMQYIGSEIFFQTRGNQVTTVIRGVSPSGKTIYISHPDLKNNLEIVSRNVYVMLNQQDEEDYHVPGELAPGEVNPYEYLDKEPGAEIPGEVQENKRAPARPNPEEVSYHIPVLN